MNQSHHTGYYTDQHHNEYKDHAKCCGQETIQISSTLVL